MTKITISAAALQVDTDIGNVSANIASCEKLALEAISQGAKWIALPEFFNTGMAWIPSLLETAEGQSGVSARFLRDFSRQHAVVIGGSFLCRVPEGGIRNRYLCFRNGELIGKHDKDIPTMWENAFYEGGDASDNGYLGQSDGIRIGSAVCWEFLRTGTARRLRNQVDVVMGGSHWWSIPTNWSDWLNRLYEPANRENALLAVQDTARLIGAPVIHASHCNVFECATPGLPIPYRGHLEGQAAIIDANGKLLASRCYEEGEGIVLASVTIGSIGTDAPIPKQFWLRKRGLLAAFSWHFHGALGRRWYAKNIR